MCAGSLGFFLLMLGMAILVIIIADVATACGIDNDCEVGHKFFIPTVMVYIIAAICFILGGIVLGIGVSFLMFWSTIIFTFLLIYNMQLRTFTRYWKLRQKLVRAARGEKVEKSVKTKKKKKTDDGNDGTPDDY